MSTSSLFLAWAVILWVPASIVMWHLWKRSIERDAEAEEFWRHLEPNRHGELVRHQQPSDDFTEEQWETMRRRGRFGIRSESSEPEE